GPLERGAAAAGDRADHRPGDPAAYRPRGDDPRSDHPALWTTRRGVRGADLPRAPDHRLSGPANRAVGPPGLRLALHRAALGGGAARGEDRARGGRRARRAGADAPLPAGRRGTRRPGPPARAVTV